MSVSSEIFQRIVREEIDSLDGVYCIADDAIIAGIWSDMAEAMKSHKTQLNNLIHRLRAKKIVMNKNKFELRVPTVVSVEHVLVVDGASRPDKGAGHRGCVQSD